MGLEEILKSIDEKVKRQVEEIKKEAQKEEGRILEQAKKRAEQHKERIIKEAKKQIEEEMRRELIKVRREEKKKTLALKTELLSKVFKEAMERFLNSDPKEYLSLMKEAIVESIKEGKQEVLLSPQDKKIIDKNFFKEVEKSIKNKKGGKYEVRFTFDDSIKEKGFIIKGEDMFINATVPTLFSVIKEEEEIEIAKILFG